MYYLITCIRNFSSEEVQQGFNVNVDNENRFTITKSHPEVQKIIFSNQYIAYIGSSGFRELASNFFGIQLINTAISKPEDRYIFLSNLMQYIGAFCTALWFVKDNAVTPSFGTISSDENGINPTMIRRNVIISNSEGKGDEVEFTREELDIAVKWYEIICSTPQRISSSKADSPKIGHNNLSSFIKFDVPSFERARHFLVAARRADFLPSKIANYISILECLFAVKGENTHRVAERAAFLVGGTNDDRIDVFNIVKDAYKVRSDYVHGSEFKNATHDSLPSISNKLDNVVRKSLVKMMLNHPELNYNNSNKKDKSKKDFQGVNDWFDELVLKKSEKYEA